jgi:hypothetical protein
VTATQLSASADIALFSTRKNIVSVELLSLFYEVEDEDPQNLLLRPQSLVLVLDSDYTGDAIFSVLYSNVFPRQTKVASEPCLLNGPVYFSIPS